MTDSKKSFEESMSELEGLVSQLERGDLPLDKSLNAFEKGSSLIKNCQDQLANAEMRVEKIMAEQNSSQEKGNI